jgi:hypothetical protein
MEIGDRVVNTTTGELGHIEEISEEYVTFRHQTPKNVPSCCLSTTNIKNLIVVPETVLPMPRSKKWHEESKEFCKHIADVIECASLIEK